MKRVLVVGAGTTGRAVAQFLDGRGTPYTLVDDGRGGPPSPDAARDLVVGHDLVVPSPGVPPHHPVLVAAAAAGVTVRSEVDLAAEHARVPFVAVTGTNGKTTVTTLIDAILRADGRRSVSAGNIGTPFISAIASDAEVIVAEVSSFQLWFTTAAFRPRVAVWTNIAPDHLDWHGSFDAYVAAKARIFANQRGDDVFVYGADDPVVAREAERAPAHRVPFSLADATALALDSADLRAPHERLNAAAAAAAARSMGVPVATITRAIASVPRLPHRLVSVGKASGVEWIDDSKATNPHAAAAAVRAFPSVVLIAGGKNKDLDLGALRDVVSHVRAVVAIGESAAEVEAAFAGAAPVTRATSMRDAVEAASAAARAGDVVLLSPACASFDWYDNYAARGDDFAAEVQRLLDREVAS